MAVRHSRPLVLVVVGLAATLAACNTGVTPTTASQPNTEGGQPTEFAFGEPADPGDADRVVEITGSDDFLFDPAEVTVRVGETVTFRVRNAGAVVHDFTLGDEAAQAEHEEEMAEMEGMEMADQPNAVSVPAGETVEVTWRFTQPGTVLIGCHQPGHYAAGMRGTITVEA